MIRADYHGCENIRCDKEITAVQARVTKNEYGAEYCETCAVKVEEWCRNWHPLKRREVGHG